MVAIHAETARVKSLTLAAPWWPGHRAGQHVDIRLTAEDGYQAERSYSIASPPEGQHRFTLTVERLDDGEVSPYLVDEVLVGDKIAVRGPIGGYFVWEARMGGPLLLIAGGSGIVPLMAMIRHRTATGSTVPTRLLYSSRTFEDIIYRTELDTLDSADPTFQVIHTLTRSSPPGWGGLRRRVDVELLRAVAWPSQQQGLAFVCGPTAFVEVVAAGLLAAGYDPACVKTERFGPTGG